MLVFLTIFFRLIAYFILWAKGTKVSFSIFKIFTRIISKRTHHEPIEIEFK